MRGWERKHIHGRQRAKTCVRALHIILVAPRLGTLFICSWNQPHTYFRLAFVEPRDISKV